MMSSVKLIAFYLPQYHPIPENDEWWGKGFTEWTNVTRATPLFPGHHQPRLPRDLGFYDLRLPATRYEQIALAKKYGIYGFCYYYYWFSGRTLLDGPLEDMLADPQTDMPFCLCWANESWSRRWNGEAQDILVKQEYCNEDPIRFVRAVVRFMHDPRYIRCDGKPLLIVYRPQEIPNIASVVSLWRRFFRAEGIGEIHLSGALTHNNFGLPASAFDSGVEFPPHNRALLNVPAINEAVDFLKPFKGCVIDYVDMAQSYLNRAKSGARIFPGVFPSWDNTARTRERSQIFVNCAPQNYEFWLSQAIRNAPDDRYKDSFVFINAWNEWAEGCYLEPDHTYGLAFLEATANAQYQPGRYSSFSNSFLEKLRPTNVSLGSDIMDVTRKHLYKTLRRSHDQLARWILRFPRVKQMLRRLFFWF